MAQPFTQRGISLIEMVVAIVVIGLAIPALTRNWYDVTVRSSRSEAMADAGFYAAQMMENITALRFDEELNPPWTPKAQFGGTRPDETDEAVDAFDDVDDLDGYSNTTQDGFLRTVQVDYISLDGAAWQTSGIETNFKRVVVRVSKQQPGAGMVTIATIVGRY